MLRCSPGYPGITQAGLESAAILLSLPLRCWNYWCAPPQSCKMFMQWKKSRKKPEGVCLICDRRRGGTGRQSRYTAMAQGPACQRNLSSAQRHVSSAQRHVPTHLLLQVRKLWGEALDPHAALHQFFPGTVDSGGVHLWRQPGILQLQQQEPVSLT